MISVIDNLGQIYPKTKSFLHITSLFDEGSKKQVCRIHQHFGQVCLAGCWSLTELPRPYLVRRLIHFQLYIMQWLLTSHRGVPSSPTYTYTPKRAACKLYIHLKTCTSIIRSHYIYVKDFLPTTIK